jgi:hypothetical protein
MRNNYAFRQAQAEYERELFDPYADKPTPEELEDMADEIGNMQFDAWHEERED